MMRIGQVAKVGFVLGAFGLFTPSLAQPSPTPPARPADAGEAAAQVQHSAPPPVEPAASQPKGPLSPAEIRELLDAAGETAKATREAVDYTRVMPDLLTQILAKLDKIEDKLDKVENAIKGQGGAPRRR